MANFSILNINFVEKLIAKRDEATEHKGQLLGKRGEVKNNIERLQTEISQPKLRDSLKIYRRANYEVQLLKLVIHDLGQYR